MGEAIAIFVVIWGWALILLALGAFIEWVGGGRSRRRRGDILPAQDRTDEGADT